MTNRSRPSRRSLAHAERSRSTPRDIDQRNPPGRLMTAERSRSRHARLVSRVRDLQNAHARRPHDRRTDSHGHVGTCRDSAARGRSSRTLVAALDRCFRRAQVIRCVQQELATTASSYDRSPSPHVRLRARQRSSIPTALTSGLGLMSLGSSDIDEHAVTG